MSRNDMPQQPIEQQNLYGNQNLLQQQQRVQQKINQPPLLSIITFPQSLKIGNKLPVLNKIKSNDQSFYCGYSNGMIVQYAYKSFHQYYAAIIDSYNQFQEGEDEADPAAYWSKSKVKIPIPDYKDVYYPYQNCDVIDIDTYFKDILLTCTHTEVTLFNTVKNKRICLKGHQQTPIAVSCHPISPLVVSVSNLVIQHDLRMQKPILVNYITPPVYDIQFFPDGQFYFLSGEPCRIGKDKWMRTLQNGIGTISKNSKFVLSNDLNKSITMWDWRKSQKIFSIKDVKNEQNYQPIHFLSKQSVNSQILFLQDSGDVLHHKILKNKTDRYSLLDLQKDQNWKSQISSQTENTKHLLLYEHEKTEVRCYNLG